jgi:hypothetical protein
MHSSEIIMIPVPWALVSQHCARAQQRPGHSALSISSFRFGIIISLCRREIQPRRSQVNEAIANGRVSTQALCVSLGCASQDRDQVSLQLVPSSPSPNACLSDLFSSLGPVPWGSSGGIPGDQNKGISDEFSPRYSFRLCTFLPVWLAKARTLEE